MITKSILLPVGVEHAFRLFTERIDEWWPPERRHIDQQTSVISLTRDRFWEAAPGRDVDLGRIRSWAPPHRIELDWYPGTDPQRPTRVEILFLPEHGLTRVQVQHQAGPHSVDLFPVRAPRFDASWDRVLVALAAAASLDNG